MPLNAAHSITELFIRWGKNQVNFLDAASANSTFAISTMGIKVTQAIKALRKKYSKKLLYLVWIVLEEPVGMGRIILEKKVRFKNALVKGINTYKPNNHIEQCKEFFPLPNLLIWISWHW